MLSRCGGAVPDRKLLARLRSFRSDWALLLLGIGAPLALTLGYVHVFGRNVPIHDEWNHMGMVRDFYMGMPWLDDVVAHYGEHRVPVPKLLILGLSPFSRLNVKLEMYLAALLMALAAGACWRLLAAAEGAPRWAIVPIGWLLISTAQYENLLVGWQFQIPLMNALVAWGFVALSAGGARGLATGAVAIGLATFSFANGLLAWPAGLPLAATAREPRHRWFRAGAWVVIAAVVAGLYTWGYSGFERVPRGYFAAPLERPGDALRLFLALYGNNFGLGRISPSIVAGAGSLLVLALAALLISRYDRWRRTDLPWLALWLFSLASVASIVIGRSFAWRDFATPSRYLTVAIFIPVVTVYAAARALGALWRRDRRSRLLATSTGLALAGGLVVAGVLTARVGWLVGPANRDLKERALPCLLAYRTAPEDCLDDLFVADGEWVRAQAPILERWRLGPFAAPPSPSAGAPGLGTVVRSDDTPSVAGRAGGTVDYLGAPPLNAEPGRARRGQAALVEGWALAPGGRTPQDVVITIDGRAAGSTSTFFSRPDVAAFYRRPVPPCGWRLLLDTGNLEPGEHEVRAHLRDRASQQLHLIGGQGRLRIVAASP